MRGSACTVHERFSLNDIYIENDFFVSKTPYMQSLSSSPLRYRPSGRAQASVTSGLRTRTSAPPPSGAMKPEVRQGLVRIAEEWAEFANIPSGAIIDVVLVGGNANYNYTDRGKYIH